MLARHSLITGLLAGISIVVLPFTVQATTDTYVSTTNWQAPTGVFYVTAEVWGAGGGGGGQNASSDGGGGGGGGAYSKKALISVTPTNMYTVTVGTHGTGGTGCTGETAGGDSWFNTTGTVLAKGGQPGLCSSGTPPAGGAGGASSSGVGDVGSLFSGGQGEKGRNSTTGRGGYGGSSGGTGSDGWSGPQTWSTQTYPTANTPTGAGDGGNGGTNGANGSAPASGNGGGGGGAGEGTNMVGGDGADGKVSLTYSVLPTLSISQPDGVSDTVNQGDSYNITYSLADSDDVVTAAFFYDTDNTGLNGTAISGACATAAEGSGVTCAWDTTGIATGSYYIYGVVNDGTNPDVAAYSSGQITINIAINPPTVSTDTESGVANTGVTMNGTISNTGGESGAGTDYGFAWGTDSTLSAGDTSTTSLGNYSGTGAFSQALTNLLSNTTYYYRAYATNSAGTGYGSTIEPFTTGIDTTPNRTMRLFEGYVLRLLNGSRLVIKQT